MTYSTVKKEIARRLARYRTKRGLTVEQLCGQVGLKTATWYKYQSGHLTPKLETLHAISVALDVPLREFFPGPRRDATANQKSRPTDPAEPTLPAGPDSGSA